MRMMTPLTERVDEKLIDLAFRKISKNEDNELKAHLVYVGDYNYWYYEDKLRSLIQYGMKKHKLTSVMVTKIYINKIELISKEETDNYYKGREYEKDSVSDDIESLLKDLRLRKEPDEEVGIHFLPKLTEEEMELVERKDTSYLQTFYNWKLRHISPDVTGFQPPCYRPLKEAKTKLSESDSKFVQGIGRRRTFTIKSSEVSSEKSSENSVKNSSGSANVKTSIHQKMF